MLEYFTYKKVKKHREEKAEKQKENGGKGKETEKQDGAAKSASSVPTSKSPSPPSPDAGRPILNQEDEKFLEQLTSPSAIGVNDDDEAPPPLPPRVKTPALDLDSDASSFASKDDSPVTKPPTKSDGKGKDKEDKTKDHKPKRFSFANISLKRKPHNKSKDASQHLAVPNATTPGAADVDPEQEVRREETDVARVLEDLDLAASGDNKAFSLSKESAETVRKFTQVLKDLVNGVPTAYGDLVSLIEDRDNVLAKSYEKLPRSLQKLVAKLPEKLTSSLAPELLAVAAEAQGLAGEGAKDGAMKKLLHPGNLMELITKPGAVVGLLKGIVNALKVRWPAFVGTNVLWSVAVFLLLSALWYCYKRGRETRLEKEASDAMGTADVVEVVDDDKLIEGTGTGAGTTPRIEEPPAEVGNKSSVPVTTAAPVVQ
ncbi:hypothetical protein F4821DRAFT_238759 [Hypoxylon rubiginosum]|uniref:Uncharacterized protein n=1 Tax=Hypoxylon rubiginosum TaxID=110542 RepID=A0ACC0D0S3_9PEZI|nr:hypothetical protein F4821DRAFT_238759 [Hypoxylon rubiginosum]